MPDRAIEIDRVQVVVTLRCMCGSETPLRLNSMAERVTCLHCSRTLGITALHFERPSIYGPVPEVLLAFQHTYDERELNAAVDELDCDGQVQ